MLRSGSLWKKHGRSSAGLLYMGPQHGKIPSNTPHFALDWMEWLEPFWQNYHAEVLAVRSTLLESEEEASKDRSWAPAALCTFYTFPAEWTFGMLLFWFVLWHLPLSRHLLPLSYGIYLCCLWRLLGHLRNSWPIWRTRPPNAIPRVLRSTSTVGPC